MKICTYNINSIKARSELLFKWLEKRDYDLDVLCLQELKQPHEKFPYDKLQELGYHAAVFAQPTYNGVAICSKNEPDTITKGFDDAYLDEQKRFMACRINGINIINVYVPHGESPESQKFTYKLEWYRHFRKYLEENFHPQDPLLVVGDFNVTRSDEDVYDAALLQDAIATTSLEREALENLAQWGLEDTFRHLYPKESGYTWWSYLGGGIWKNEGMRLDYIWATSPLLKHLENVEVDMWPRKRRKPTPSDHAPVLAEFNLP